MENVVAPKELFVATMENVIAPDELLVVRRDKY